MRLFWAGQMQGPEIRRVQKERMCRHIQAHPLRAKFGLHRLDLCEFVGGVFRGTRLADSPSVLAAGYAVDEGFA